MVAKGHTRASTLTSRLNARHRFNTGPLIERSERSYFFENPKSKIVPSTAIFVNRCPSQWLGIDFNTLSVKKHRTLYLTFPKV
jgi:hypothetical protein